MKEVHCLAVASLLGEAVGEVHLEVRLGGVQADRVPEAPLGEIVRTALHEVHPESILGIARE